MCIRVVGSAAFPTHRVPLRRTASPAAAHTPHALAYLEDENTSRMLPGLETWKGTPLKVWGKKYAYAPHSYETSDKCSVSGTTTPVSLFSMHDSHIQLEESESEFCRQSDRA